MEWGRGSGKKYLYPCLSYLLFNFYIDSDSFISLIWVIGPGFHLFFNSNIVVKIENHFCEKIVCQIYPVENQLNQESILFLLRLSISNGIVVNTIYNKRDYFNFEKVNFPLLKYCLNPTDYS